MKPLASATRASVAALVCSSFALLSASSARADILPAAGTPTVTASGFGTYFWTYNVFVSQAQSVVTGDFFTIYDFAGLTGTPTGPASFTPSVSLLNTPVATSTGLIFPNDDPTLPNVTYTYSGPTIAGGPTPLGLFTLESIFAPPGTLVAFVGRGTDQDTGLANGNITNTFGPSTDVRPPGVPEPGAYAFGLLAAGSLFGLMARKCKKA